jgi:hypothetical protein
VSAREENFLDYFDKNHKHDFTVKRHENVSSEYSTNGPAVGSGRGTTASGSFVPFGLSAKTVSNIRRPESNQDMSSQANTDATADGSRYKVFKG